MSDLNQILAGTVEDVISVVDMLSIEQLTELKTLEEGGKNRKGVISAIDAAIAALQVVAPPPVVENTPIAENGSSSTADDMVDDEPVMPAPTVPSIDVTHPALDTNLRAGTSDVQNRIDFNDPRANGREVVEAALAAQIEG